MVRLVTWQTPLGTRLKTRHNLPDCRKYTYEMERTNSVHDLRSENHTEQVSTFDTIYSATDSQTNRLWRETMNYFKGLFQPTLGFSSSAVQSDENMVDDCQRNDVVDQEPYCSRNINDLPVEATRHIFSYLDVRSLWRASRVCVVWQRHADDPVLWSRKLRFDSRNWDVIDHLRDPELYKETSELSVKEIYARCCPEGWQSHQSHQFLPHMPRISFYFGFSIPRIVMFGPGLESSTSGLLTKLLWDKMSPFTVKKMFPGQFEGIGSGVCLQYNGGLLNLITLYGSTRSERERQHQSGSPRQNRLFLPDTAERSQRDVEMGLSPVVVTQPVRELCSTIDAFIYVIDASSGNSTVQYAWNEFEAMILKNKWIQPKAPLLVLSCTANSSSSKVPALTVVDLLDLRELNRRWQVRNCQVETMYGFLPGIQWLCREIANQ